MSKPASDLEKVAQFAPKLAQLSTDVLFGDIWARSELSPRERSIATVAALTALYRPEQLPGHLQKAMANGVTKSELGELITHLAFYAGWPAAASAVNALAALPE
ncbi:carboxymuconolactone decarboxylase family protein [Burkholderia lata]|uniref:4-carboxymuconolactone decarboxylase n=1 Tax=Burkholderia lata (strain ATCC 17760 / DSM 23089 / LMG 22485 / NCIMB 9086 / R18194 / 383) TaxID=482957 RepID=A0A6P3C803_BURL3|nr:carboxymuconolactone decarboxylase family protein [Burkholderia lata]VWB89195.1 4-carboxymuconolactone decarboxylase [Burkholderia lata]VWM07681.1 4-carboxymuconolactone decarboxylase [Burkholderia lata]